MTTPSTIAAQKNGIVKALDRQENAYRLEIDEFVQDTPMLNLFLLALEALQDNSVLNPTEQDSKEAWEKYWWSYYCIAGIHGEPSRQAWVHEHSGSAGELGWYCQHSTTWFPTWHRAYVLMMEQAVFNKMYAIAHSYTDERIKAGYLEAVRRFRFPYWDPWMPRNKADPQDDWNGLFGVPEILRAQEVFVRRPEDPKHLQQTDNPLYRYAVPDSNGVRSVARIPWDAPALAKMPIARNQTTIRTPGGSKTTRNNDIIFDYELRSQVDAENTKLLQTILNLPGTTQSWEVFSNNKSTPPQTEMSLESWHDNFHVLSGLGRGEVEGNMCLQEVAGALHPDQYVSKTDLEEPLKPFYKGAGDEDVWTSVETKDWKQCGFAVPGTKDTDPDQLRQNVAAYIKKNYFWMAGREKPPANLGFPKSMDSVEALIGRSSKNWNQIINIKAVNAETSGLVTRTISVANGSRVIDERPAIFEHDITSRDKNAHPEFALDGNRQRTWNIHLKVRKSFIINAFIGDVSDNAAEAYLLLDNQVGFSGIFASNKEASCLNCKKQRAQDVLYGDVIPLTTFLVGCLKSNNWVNGPPDHLKVLDSLEPKDVVPFLTKRLEWRITTADGVLKSEQDVRDSGLEIKIMDRWYHYPTVEEPLGRYEEPHLHVDVTRGKVGGYSG